MSRCYNTEQFAFLLYTFYIQNKRALNPHHWFVSWNYPSGVFLLCYLLTHKIKVPLILENTQKHWLNLIISGYNSEAEFNSNHSFIAELQESGSKIKLNPGWEATGNVVPWIHKGQREGRCDKEQKQTEGINSQEET